MNSQTTITTYLDAVACAEILGAFLTKKEHEAEHKATRPNIGCRLRKDASDAKNDITKCCNGLNDIIMFLAYCEKDVMEPFSVSDAIVAVCHTAAAVVVYPGVTEFETVHSNMHDTVAMNDADNDDEHHDHKHADDTAAIKEIDNACHKVDDATVVYLDNIAIIKEIDNACHKVDDTAAIKEINTVYSNMANATDVDLAAMDAINVACARSKFEFRL
jgi:hypothetical protein